MKKPENAVKDRRQINGNTLLLLITIALFIVMYAVGCVIYAGKGFTHLQNFLNILITNAGLLCVACGMTCVMLTGGIDISVGALIAMDCMLLAVGMSEWGMNPILLCVLVLVIGVVFGTFQGFCVGYLEIQPFIVSMAGMFFCRGMTAVISTDQVSVPSDSLFYTWANLKINLPFGGYYNKKGILQVPYIRVGVVIALVVLVIIFLVLRYTKFGRSLYAVGGSEQSAAMMGLDVKRTKMEAYILSSSPPFSKKRRKTSGAGALLSIRFSCCSVPVWRREARFSRVRTCCPGHRCRYESRSLASSKERQRALSRCTGVPAARYHSTPSSTPSRQRRIPLTHSSVSASA